MVEGGMKCVKFILFAFNLIFFLAGLGLIIAGAVVQTRFSAYFNFFNNQVSAAAILLIVVGVIIFIIGFFGCCGAYKENYCMTMTFAVLLAMVFILEIAAGIAAYVMKEQVHDMVEEKMVDALDNYDSTKSGGVTKAWDTLQHDFKCCGVNGKADWKNNTHIAAGSVPDSCCEDEQPDCGKTGQTQSAGIQGDGCIEGFIDWVKSNIYIIGGVGIGLAFVQIFGIIIACCLAQSIRKEYETV